MRIMVRDLTPGQIYQLQVRSRVGDEFSGWSHKLVVETEVDQNGPADVENLSWTVEGTAFRATWDPVTTEADGEPLNDFKQYRIVIENSFGANVLRTTTVEDFLFTFEDNVAAFGDPDPELTIFVVAEDDLGNVSQNPATATATNPSPGAPPTADADEFSGAINLYWTAPSDNDLIGYVVHVSTTGSSFTPNAGNLVTKGDFLAATHYTVAYGVDHYYKIAAVDVFGSVGTFITIGPYQPVDVSGGGDVVDPDDPENVTVSVSANPDPSGQYIDLTVGWDAPATDPSLANFQVRYGYDGTNWNYLEVPGDEVSAKVSRLLAGGNIYVQVRAKDFSANTSAWVNAGTYPIAGPKDTTGPSQPAAPTGATGSMRIQAAHNLQKQSGGALEPDLDYFEVYAGTSSGFTADSTSMLGTMKANVVAVQTFDIPASAATGDSQDWYLKVIAVDRAGNKSPVSPASSVASVDLILSANIGEAQIENAHITDLEASKLTAGDGIINDLTVKATLTIGESASSLGAIQSFGYSAGVDGFRLDKTGLEINDGSIAAAAIKIQSSPNLIPAQYAGMEYAVGYYTEQNQVFKENVDISLIDTDSKYEARSLDLSWDSASTKRVWMGNSDTNYNIPVEPGVYIYSYYVKSTEASGTVQIQPKFKMDDGTTILNGTNETITFGTGWLRKSGTFTVPSGVAECLMFFEFADTTGALRLDALQVERQMGALTTPGVWNPPGTTSIDGGAIITGFLDADRIDADTIKGIHIDGESITGDHLATEIALVSTLISQRRDEAGVPYGNKVTINEEGISLWKNNTGIYERTVYIPTDPEESARFEGTIVASEISVLNGATLRSENNELARSGGLTMVSGTTKPSAMPKVELTWDTYQAITMYPEEGESIHGLTIGHDSKFYFILQNAFGDPYDYVRWYDTSTGTSGEANELDGGWEYTGGLVYASHHSGRYYMLQRQMSSGHWYIASYDTSFTFINYTRVLVNGVDTTGMNKPILGWDYTNSNLIMARTYGSAAGSSSGDVIVENWNGQSSGLVTFASGSAKTSPAGYNFNTDLGVVGYGPFDHPVGTQRIIFKSSTLTGWRWQLFNQPFGTNWTEDEGWFGAHRGATIGGCWDATNGHWWTLDTAGRLCKYEGDRNYWVGSNDDTWAAALTYRDTNTDTTAEHETSLGSNTCAHGGVHETDLGTRAAFSMEKRAQIRITANALPVYGVGVPGYDDDDDPNAYGFFVGHGSTAATATMHRQPNPAAGVLTMTLTDWDDAGAAAPSTNNFPFATPAYIKTGSLRAEGTPRGILRADGTGHWDGLRPPGEITAFAGTTAPTGWLICNGASLSTTTYATLFAALGYTYGGSGANFNIPDLRGRVVIGAVTGGWAELGENDGVTNSLARSPLHTHGIQTQAAHSHGKGTLAASSIDRAAGGAPTGTNPITGSTADGGGHAHGGNTDQNAFDSIAHMGLNWIIKT